jgi:hypothetical protein
MLVESFVAEMGVEDETQHPEQKIVMRKLDYIIDMGKNPDLEMPAEQAQRQIIRALETENLAKISAALELGKQVIAKANIPDWVK